VNVAALREHLIASRIAGDVATPRHSNVGNMRRLVRGEPYAWLGVRPEREYSFEDLLQIMVDRCGINPDPAYADGPDTIDPELTLDGLDAMGDRLAKAARNREQVFVATGHPSGVMAIHMPVASALAQAGCELLTPTPGRWLELPDGRRNIRYVGCVGVMSTGGDLNHTHSALPIQSLLDDGLQPDLVLADHGWAGGAGQAGIDTLGFADCNDPALFVGAAEGKLRVVVPLDDNVQPHLYEPLTLHLLAAVG
jgi:hypothetical protein